MFERNEARRQRIRLRSVDAGLARLRALIGSGLRAEIMASAAPLRVEVTGARQARAAPPRESLRLDTPGGPVSLAPARELVRALTAIDLPDDHDTDPLHSLRLELAAQAMPSGWLELFAASTVLSGSPGAAEPLEATLSVIQPGVRLGLSVTLHGSSEALLQLLSRQHWRRLPAPASPLPPDWTLKLPVRLGYTELPLHACRALAPGDVVAVTHPFFDVDGDGEVRIGRRSAGCRLHVGNRMQLELTEWNAITMDSHMKEPQAIHPFNDDEALDDIPVVLTFEVGTLELTLSDLKALSPGCLLPVAGPLPPEVAVCAGGRRIGTAELVELDGRLGVEIRRIGAPT